MLNNILNFFKNFLNIFFFKKNNYLIKKIEKKLNYYNYSVSLKKELLNHIKHYNLNNKKDIILYFKKFFIKIFFKIKNKKRNYKKLLLNNKPYIFFIIGVNGVGKTSIIAKLALLFKKKYKNKKLLIVAGDTFKISAIEQLINITNKINIKIFKKELGTKTNNVILESIQYANLNNFDFLFIDTSGRLHNNKNLLNELKNNQKTIYNNIYNKKYIETILVIDSLTGKIVNNQIKKFKKKININSIIITKFDIYQNYDLIIRIYKKYKIPIKYISYGNNINYIDYFNPKKFIKNLIKKLI